MTPAQALFRLSTAVFLAAVTYGAARLALALCALGLPLVVLIVPLACFWLALLSVTIEAWLGRLA